MDSKKVSLGVIFVALLFITSSARSAEFIIQQVTEGRGAEYNRSYSLNENPGVTRVLREERPSSKIVTITSFSMVHNRPVPYESSVFEAAGYKWRLVLYVIGNKDDGGDDHVSLYVRIEDTSYLREGWEVDVDLKLFVHNPKLHKYLSVTDGIVKRFNDENKEWGYGKLIPLSTFSDTNEGYIVDDTCSFGAEIFVIKQAEVQEKLTFINNPANSVFTWRVEHFSTLQNKYYYSDEFLVGDRYWRLGFVPRTSGATLPIYLYAQGFKADAVVTNTYGGGNLRLKNQQGGNDRERYSAAWYPISSGSGVGVHSIISLKDLNDASKGYLVNDSIVFEVEMVKVSVTNIVPV